MRVINLKKLITSLLIPLAAGFLGWIFTICSIDIYSKIMLPPPSPPGTVFPIVWTLLYILMGISLHLVRSSADAEFNDKKRGYIFFGLQLAFNFGWSIVFFNLGCYLFSAIWLTALIALIAFNIFYFVKVSKTAAWLLAPYLVWCLFALYLNIGIVVLN